MNNAWEIKQFGDVLEIRNGRNQREVQCEDGKFPIYGSGGNVMGYANQFLCDAGTTIIGRKGSINNPIYIDTPFWNVDTAFGLSAKSNLDSRYLYYFCISYDFSRHNQGTTIPSLVKTDLLKISIPLPPIEEQKRIVAILDEAFAAIDKAKQNAEKNLKNARELFESYLQNIFTNPGDDWKETTLEAEIDLLAGFAFKSALYTNSETDIRLLRGDNIIPGSLRWEDVKRWSASDIAEYERYQISEGDVVLAMDRPWIKAGLKCAQISSADIPSLLVQRTARLRGNGNLKNRFLFRLIGSAAFTRHILGIQTGIGVPHISGQQIKDFPFSKPPIKEQIRIAKNVDEIAAECTRLETIYQQKLGALDELKKSILQKAFNGKF